MAKAIDRSFNPRFYGEAGRTIPLVNTAQLAANVSIPDFMGRPVELEGRDYIELQYVTVSIPDFMGRPVEPAMLISQQQLRQCFNPRFYGEAGRTF